MTDASARRGLWERLKALVADSLPMSPDDREARDTAGLPRDEVEGRRREQLEVQRFEKKGRGGYR